MKKKITMAVGLVMLCLGQACALDPTEMEMERPNQAIASIHALPQELLPLILAESSKGPLHPVTFHLVSPLVQLNTYP